MEGYYLMPHPPIIVPNIGKGEDLKLYQTSLAFHNISQEIASIEPETIIVITPHGPMFSDAISVSEGEAISGDFRRFQCYDISIQAALDMEFNEELFKLAQEEQLPVVGVDHEVLRAYGRPFELDHGTLVPLYFINKYYSDYKLVHITYAPLSDRQLYQFGILLDKVVQRLQRQAVIIASGDLSHKLSESGPYSYSPYGEEFDRQFLHKLSSEQPLDIFSLDLEMIEEAAECGLRSTKILLGALDGKEVKGEVLSYQSPFGVGYGIVKFNVKGDGVKALKYIGRSEKPRQQVFSKGTNPYVQLARKCLEDYFTQTKTMIAKEELPEIMVAHRHGVFVSLKKDGQLRGCIGTIFPTTDCVASEIIRNAIAAATEDPRFLPVRYEELKSIDISLDVLMPPVKANIEELDPKRYGVIVSKGMRKGVLLPNLEGIYTVEDQLSIACQKAGINPDGKFEIQKFEVIRYKEGE